MRLDRPLMTVTPTVDGDVLVVLARADAAFTAPRVQRLIGRHSVPGVRAALNRLAAQGVVDAERTGRTVAYHLNRGHLAAPAIVELANLREALIQRVRDTVSAWARPAQLVMLFGSAASGQMHDDSDIDLLVIGDAEDEDERWSEQLADLEQLATTWTGNDTRVLAYTVDELGHGADPVVDDIARTGIHIIGDRSLFDVTRRRAG